MARGNSLELTLDWHVRECARGAQRGHAGHDTQARESTVVEAVRRKAKPSKAGTTASPAATNGAVSKSAGANGVVKGAVAKSAAAKSAITKTVAQSPEPDLKAARKLALEMMAIPGKSGEERRIVEFIRGRLLKAGVPAGAIAIDNVNTRSPLGGEIGNLIVRLPGTIRGPRRLLMAHVDTVPLCEGSRPKQQGEIVRSGNAHTALGADDRSGAAVVLQTVVEILRRKLPHPPLTLFWPVQEEVGLLGARFVALAQLGRPQLAFNWDGGSAEKVTIGATGAYRMKIAIDGIASHAGAAPECGVSAIAIAGIAIADLNAGGWLGDIRRDGQRGTSNLGHIDGGGATNVVPDRVVIRGECRSHDREFRQRILDEITAAFTRAAAQVKNAAGKTGQASVEASPAYESFALASDEPAVVAAREAVASLGLAPQLAISNGGLDANWLSARGIPTVTLGCGQKHAHTLAEELDLAQFDAACRIALRLATAV